METSTSRRRSSNGAMMRSSPAGSSWSSTFASSSSSFSPSPTAGFMNRSTSPTRVSLYSSNSHSSPSVRFSIDRSVSPSRSISVTSPRGQLVRAAKKTCMCSPTTHPGSFRCSLHKNSNNSNGYATSYSQNRLNSRRSAMTNSLVRLGVEGDLVKRALAALIRPSSHQQRRRTSFCPRPSRLSVMTKADDL